MEQESNLDVLPMFEEAVRVVLEVRPPRRSAVCGVLQLISAGQDYEGATPVMKVLNFSNQDFTSLLWWERLQSFV